MISYQFQLTNRAGDSVNINDFTTDPANFIALQEYPLFDVDVKNSELDKEGQHGIWDFSSFYGKRVMSFSGIIVGQSEAQVETLKKALQRVLVLPAQPDDSNDGMVLVQWTDANNAAWQIFAKVNSAIRFDRAMRQSLHLNFVFTLKAPQPEIESQTETAAIGTRGWLTGALKLPTLLPAAIPAGCGNGLSLTNAGNAWAHIVVRLYGISTGITNPAIYNATTGKLFKVNKTLIDQEKWIEIDSKTGTVIDQDGYDCSGLVDAASEYVLLQPGTNTLVYLSDESAGATNPVNTWILPTGQFSINYRDTVI